MIEISFAPWRLGEIISSPGIPGDILAKAQSSQRKRFLMAENSLALWRDRLFARNPWRYSRKNAKLAKEEVPYGREFLGALARSSFPEYPGKDDHQGARHAKEKGRT